MENIDTLALVGSNSFTDNIGSVFGLLNTKIVLDGMHTLRITLHTLALPSMSVVLVFCTKKWSHCKIHWKLSNDYWRSNICVQ